MVHSKSVLNISNPKVIIGLFFFLIIIGGTALDSNIGFICFALAEILLPIAVMKGKKIEPLYCYFLANI